MQGQDVCSRRNYYVANRHAGRTSAYQLDARIQMIANLLMYFLDQKVMQTRRNDGAVKARWTPLCEINQKLEDFLGTFLAQCLIRL